MKTEKELVILDYKGFKNICQMFDSPERSNHLTAMRVLMYLPVKENAAYILCSILLYSTKTGTKELDEWGPLITHLDKVLNYDFNKEIFNTYKYSTLERYLKLYTYIKDNFPYDLPVLVEVWKEMVKPFMTNLGYGELTPLLKNIQLKKQNYEHRR